jgi:hypothetical protein
MPIGAEIELNQGTAGPQVREAFAANGQPLDPEVKVTKLTPDDVTLRWEVWSADRRYLVRKRDWLPDLAVYFSGDNRFLGDLPDGVDFGLSVGQAIRRGLSDGLVLEDERIEANYYYRMTRNDVLSHNVDLIEFACSPPIDFAVSEAWRLPGEFAACRKD